jgi:hypothetical protein
MKKLIKLYGERNTSTNYLSKLIELNLDAIEIPGTVPPRIGDLPDTVPGNELVRDIYFRLAYAKTLGWKHTRVKPFSALRHYRLVRDRTVFVTITKNPYSWLLSLHQRPYHQRYSDRPAFEEFLRRRWKTVWRDNLAAASLLPVELWNVKNRSYVQSGHPDILNLTSEAILNDPEQVIRTMSDRYTIPMKQSAFVNYERSTKEAGKNNAYYRDYYLCERWRDKLSDEAVAIINESLDDDLMTRFGYCRLPTHVTLPKVSRRNGGWVGYISSLPLVVDAISECLSAPEIQSALDQTLSAVF